MIISILNSMVLSLPFCATSWCIFFDCGFSTVVAVNNLGDSSRNGLYVGSEVISEEEAVYYDTKVLDI